MASVEDDPMLPHEEEEEEGEGDVVMPGAEDSSEEEEDDEEEARRVREGFIVDEDDEEEEEEVTRRRRRKRARRQQEDEDLEEDDLALLEENTGTSFKNKKNRLTRLRRRDGSQSPPVASSSRRHNLVVSSDDDLDNDEPRRTVQDLHSIWENQDDDGQDTDDFIDDSDDPDAMNDQERDERRKRQQQVRRKMARARPELTGIDASSWQEIFDVFGDGRDYDYALDDDEANEGEYQKPETKFVDVFEPTAIRSLFLTEDDDLIRVKDIPERMQLASSTFSKNPVITPSVSLAPDDIDDAAAWVTQRISLGKTADYFRPAGKFRHLSTELVAAVTYALRQLFIEHVEVPYIWHHRRDYIIHFGPDNHQHTLLVSEDLWRVYALGQKYCSLLDRRRGLGEAYDRLKVTDPYYEEDILARMDSAEVVADTSEWLLMKYKDRKDDEVQFRFHDDDEPEAPAKHKMPSRISAYQIAKNTVVSKLAQEGFGIQAHEIVQNFVAQSHVNFLVEQELNPLVYAEQFVSPDPLQEQTPEELLRRARMILATELGKDPMLRDYMRKTFKDDGLVTVDPTDQGVLKIGEDDPFFNFKYLSQKPIREMFSDAQFLHMLKAEEKTLITISITLSDNAKATFERRLASAFESDNFSESARAWNEQGSLVVREVMELHLLPMGAKWIREYLRDEVEDILARHCAEMLRKRIDVAPTMVRGMKEDRPSVLAISWGKGDPHKDVITAVYLDPRGRMREQTRLDNLSDNEPRDEFIDLLRRRQPDVIGVSGFNMSTPKLMVKVKEIVRGLGMEASSADTERFLQTPILYIRDEVARLYQHSQRAKDEFSSYPLETKYCVGLARYVQSPLNEYAALGSDISTLLLLSDSVKSFNHDPNAPDFAAVDQHLVPMEKLWIWCERVVIDVVNKVGVDINRAVGDAYYQTLLPYVCGLGPRKAQHLVKMIERLGENMINREQFIKSGLLTKSLFINAAGFIRITQQEDPKSQAKFRAEDEHSPDPLDNTRIHPEDYELARKMAMDALEYDEDDIHDKHPSWVVGLIMDDPENDRKLSELNLDEFAVSLKEANNDLKRHTLNVIRNEFLRPFSEQRLPFPWLDGREVLTMLSGETSKSLREGLIISTSVIRSKNNSLQVKLDSGIEGVVNSDAMFDEAGFTTKDIPQKGQTITARVLSVKAELETDNFLLELSIKPSDMQNGDAEVRKTTHDHYWDSMRYNKDRDMLARKKRAEVDRSRKVIKHPNFHNFNTAQAEAFLEKQQRGDVVIRPSSKGADHIAVTWKVEDQLYQHIDVTEVNDPRALGTQYIVDATHTYSDLDELIVNHVQAMARKVEELMAHDRYKNGSEDDLHLFLKNSLAANPGKSMYGFALNRKKPGHFSLCFLANKNSHVQNWPVRVTPESYMLFDAAAVGVPELCDAFKVRHLHESQNQQAAAAGGKTPFGAGGRTPARPGNATPGHMSVRQPARTPNPYGGAATPSRYGPPPGIPQAVYGYAPNQPPPAPYGYQTPGHPPPFPPPGQPLPGGMNPQRAAMIQQGGMGWP